MNLGIHDWPMFIAAGLLLNITPGVDMALVASRAALGGFRAGAAAALGVGAGCGVHIAAGALGVAALLAGSAWAFTALRWVGAAYLVWLGIGLWRQGAARPPPASIAAPAAQGRGRATPVAAARWSSLFMQGFLTNALNPKVALFFLAFVPQFVSADSSRPGLAFVVLGAAFVVSGTLVNLGLAAAVSAWRFRLSAPGPAARWRRWLPRLAGSVFVALGLKLAADSTR